MTKDSNPSALVPAFGLFSMRLCNKPKEMMLMW